MSLTSPTSTWWRLLEAGKFSTHGPTILLFAVFVLLAVAAGVRATPVPRVTRADLELTALGLGTWFAMDRAAPALLAHDVATHQTWGLAVLVVLGVALKAVITYVARGKRLALLAAVPLFALAARRFDHTTLAFCLAAISLALLVAFIRPRRAAVTG